MLSISKCLPLEDETDGLSGPESQGGEDSSQPRSRLGKTSRPWGRSRDLKTGHRSGRSVLFSGSPFRKWGSCEPQGRGCGAPPASPFLCLHVWLCASCFYPLRPLASSPRRCGASYRMNFCLQKEMFKLNPRPHTAYGESLLDCDSGHRAFDPCQLGTLCVALG